MTDDPWQQAAVERTERHLRQLRDVDEARMWALEAEYARARTKLDELLARTSASKGPAESRPEGPQR